MRLTTVTMTGADESVQPIELLRLSQKYPFVEWGILVSQKQMGSNRFPDPEWIEELTRLGGTTHVDQRDLRLSVHLCGQWVRDLLVGKVRFFPKSFASFQRMQLNFHAEDTDFVASKFVSALSRMLYYRMKQYLFQFDGNCGHMYYTAVIADTPSTVATTSFPFFDTSHGAGVSPDKWPSPIPKGDGTYPFTGYGGGLGPDNLETEIERIREAVDAVNSKTPVWIDMETKIRSNGDSQFDLKKVEECLEIASKFIYRG